ncbi:unnamed protein product [Lymnaea stagnalis]|uniref:DNA excision repair protein ERCC-6-like 2 n=1 Tax=Lymnaea stagnalis TaxID=6523 RepID=A0AAV2HQ26_LYMST
MDIAKFKLWEELWLKDTESEKPKFSIPPIGAKVNFQLTKDGSQPPVIVPATINQYLRDYQREGIEFLYDHYSNNTGAILGDDMGLGKTVQVIGLLSALLGKQGNKLDTLHAVPKFIRQLSREFPASPSRRACKPFLIIGPTAVMFKWLDEIDTWGYFTASKFHGADKDGCLADLKKGKLEIIVTTFETFRDHVDRLNEVEWEAVIVDEVHKIKGLKAQITQSLRRINTPRRFGLTGTALQNSLTDLFSILDWAKPGVLGSLKKFEKDFMDVIEMGQRHDATKRELAQARKQKDKFAEMRKKNLLRRTKALIADQLPKKEDLVVLCKLTDLQISVYKAILSHPDMELVLHSEDPCGCDSGKQRSSCCYKVAPNGMKVQALVFSYMHLMLKAANHIALLLPDDKMSEKQATMTRLVCEVAFKEHPQFVEQTQLAAFRTLSDPKYCGKMKILAGLLSVFASSHDKVLVFSYSSRLLDIIEQYVISQGHEYRKIDGKVNSLRRRDIVIEFNKDNNIFMCLISTKAGGLGLNMTAANRVVIFDPNWNPSHDMQAEDRAYRLGQTRNVQVFRLVSAGTIEENIYLRQIYKQQLDEVAVGTGNARRYFFGKQGDRENQGELFGVKNIFTLRTGESSLTLDVLKRNENIEKSLAGYDITKYVPPMVANSSEVDISSSDDDRIPEEDADNDEESFMRNLFGADMEGVLCTVANEKVVGSSRAEDHMTHCAMEDVFENHINSQAPALRCEPYTQSYKRETSKRKMTLKGKGRKKVSLLDHNTKQAVQVGCYRVLVGQTPAAIQRQQWAELCKFKSSDDLNLARTLLPLKVEGRLELLKEFYSQQHPQLSETVTKICTMKTVQCQNLNTNRKILLAAKKEQPANEEDISSSSKYDKFFKVKRTSKNYKTSNLSMASDCLNSVIGIPLEKEFHEVDSQVFIPTTASQSQQYRDVSSSGKSHCKTRQGSKVLDSEKVYEHFDFIDSININKEEKCGASSDNIQTLRYMDPTSCPLKETDKDMFSLMHGMGNKTSNAYSMETKINNIKMSLCSEFKNPKKVTDLHTNQKSCETNQNTSSKELKLKHSLRNYACILDDIFESSDREPQSNPMEGGKFEINENKYDLQ